MAKLLLLLTVALFASVAQAATYYVDYAAGSDINNGASTTSPWKRCPGMAGFAGAYSHQAGDRFILKGGVTWPRVCFPMTIAYGGSAVNARDYYGVDATWYTGGAWARPIFDFEHTLLSSAGIWIKQVNFVHIDNIEFRRHYSTGTGWYGGPDNQIYLQYASGCRVTNSLFHNWSYLPTASGGIDGMICVLGYGGSNNDVDDCVFDGTAAVSGSRGSGAAVQNLQNHRRNVVKNVSNAFNVSGSGETAYNDIGPVLRSFTDTVHENGYQTLFVGTYSFHHNKVHDIYHGVVMLVGNGASEVHRIYDNLYYGALTAHPVQLDGRSGMGTAYIYNNTFVFDGPAIRNNVGSTFNLIARNNHVIGTGASLVLGTQGEQSHNLVQTRSQASAEGYALSNWYAPFSGTASTVNAGTGNVGGLFTTDLRDVARPQDGAWDIGAYEFNGAVSQSSVPAITSQRIAAGTVGTAFSYQIAASGNPASYGATGLPSGLSIDATNGLISGTVPALGDASVTVSATNSAGTGTATLVITITAPTEQGISIAAASGKLFPGTVSSFSLNSDGSISQPIETLDPQQGGKAIYTFSILSAGDYVINASVNASSATADSFFVNLGPDGSDQPLVTSPTMIWDVAHTSGFEPRTVFWRGESGSFDRPQYAPKVFRLSPGAYQLVIGGREVGTALKGITIVPASTWRPVGVRSPLTGP